MSLAVLLKVCFVSFNLFCFIGVVVMVIKKCCCCCCIAAVVAFAFALSLTLSFPHYPSLSPLIYRRCRRRRCCCCGDFDVFIICVFFSYTALSLSRPFFIFFTLFFLIGFLRCSLLVCCWPLPRHFYLIYDHTNFRPSVSL